MSEPASIGRDMVGFICISIRSEIEKKREEIEENIVKTQKKIAF